MNSPMAGYAPRMRLSDAQGYIYIHDRYKDMIVSGGENIYPTKIWKHAMRDATWWREPR